ncbi:hypothetical protein DSO57_1035601, partial [Entomophthora muscae]
PITLPVTLRPNCLQETVIVNELTSAQLFGVLYIMFAGLVDSMVPINGSWALLGKLFSYIMKLAHILWWACPSGPTGCLPTSSPELAGSLTVLNKLRDYKDW